MAENRIDAGPGMHVVDGVLIVQAPDKFDDEALGSLRKNVLNGVHALQVRAVVLDVSTIAMLDSVGYGLLADLARTVTLLGAGIVLAGFQPGVVAALMDLDVDGSGVTAVRNVAEGLELLRPEPVAEEEETGEEHLPEDDEDTTPDPDSCEDDQETVGNDDREMEISGPDTSEEPDE